MPLLDDLFTTVDIPWSLVPDKRPETRIHLIKGRDGVMLDVHWTEEFTMQKNMSGAHWTDEYPFQKELSLSARVPPAKTIFDHLLQDDLLPES